MTVNKMRKNVGISLGIIGLVLILVSIFYIENRDIEKTIKQIPTVDTVTYKVRENDWENIYTVYLRMKDGMKIVLYRTHYDNHRVLRFDKIWRMGDIVPWEYSYNKKNEELSVYSFFDISENVAYLTNFSSIIYDKNVKDILLHEKEVYESLKQLPLVNISYYDYCLQKGKQSNIEYHKSQKVYMNMIDKKKSIDQGDFIYGYFRTKPSETMGVFIEK